MNCTAIACCQQILVLAKLLEPRHVSSSISHLVGRALGSPSVTHLVGRMLGSPSKPPLTLAHQLSLQPPSPGSGSATEAAAPGQRAAYAHMPSPTRPTADTISTNTGTYLWLSPTGHAMLLGSSSSKLNTDLLYIAIPAGRDGAEQCLQGSSSLLQTAAPQY